MIHRIGIVTNRDLTPLKYQTYNDLQRFSSLKIFKKLKKRLVTETILLYGILISPYSGGKLPGLNCCSIFYARQHAVAAWI
jgi:hypothetical protein